MLSQLEASDRVVRGRPGRAGIDLDRLVQQLELGGLVAPALRDSSERQTGGAGTRIDFERTVELGLRLRNPVERDQDRAE